jgi:glycosyltransferase involved in cell wall biosynthesis
MYQDPKPLSTKTKVIISGVLPPPMGGMTAYYQTLLNSSLPNLIDLHFVQTSSQNRKLSISGKLSLANLYFAIKDCWRFTWAIVTVRPQIAHIGTAAGLSFLKNSICVTVAKIFGAHVLFHPHCSLSFLYHERSKWWRWYFRQVISQTDGVIAISKEWLQLPSIRPGSEVYYLPNAINTNEYHNLANEKLAQLRKDGPIRILYLGNLGKEKGSFDLLIAAYDLHSHGINMIFDLVGGELNHGELQLLNGEVKKQELEDVVRIHDPAYGSDKLAYLREADIFVFPSYFEGMPMAILEAMACGLPIVASRVGGIPDLIEDGVNGILVEPGKPDQIAFTLRKLGNDYKLRNSMAKANSKAVCEKYDIEQHVTKLINIYTIILSTS